MTTVELSTHLPADPAMVREQIMRPATLLHVSRPLIRFTPIDPPALPEVWKQDRYKVAMHLFGVVPIGWQMVGIEMRPAEGETWSIRDNGHGALIRTWDHIIEVAPEGEGTRYTDRVTIEAGWLTPAVVLFARIFYGHRQRRWRQLVASGFDRGG